MDTKELKRLITKEFGAGLEHATPANVRDFLDRMGLNVISPETKGRIILEERASTYEEILKDFFVKVLELPKDEAVMLLWLLAFDLTFSAIELQHEDKLRTLFKELEES
jgi:hypothetical protein